MPKTLPSLLEYFIEDAASSVSGITAKSMFGGWGLYKDGIIFAIADDEKVYLKVDDSNRTDYEIFGSGPFVFEKKDGIEATMSYYELPGEIFENRDELPKWIEKSVQVSMKKNDPKL